MATDLTRRTIRESAAGGLKLLTLLEAGTVSTVDRTAKIPGAYTKIPDPYTQVGGTYIMSRADDATGNDFDRVLRYVMPQTLDTFELSSGPQFAEEDPVGIYTLLSPEDFNDAIQEALQEMWRTVRIPIEFIQSDNEYAIDDLVDSEGDVCNWVTNRGLIERVEIKSTSGQTIDLREWAGVKYTENNNSVTINFTYLPGYRDDASLSAVLVVNKYYVQPGEFGGGMLLDADTTVCPFGLINLATQVKVLKKAFLMLGADAMRNRFGAQLNIKEAELAKMKVQLMPPMAANFYNIEETFWPDIPHEMLHPSW